MSRYYRIEMHAHTRETSPCACVNAPELVERYLARGYDAIVITDHLSPGNFMSYYENNDWEGALEAFLAGYRAVKKEAGDRMRVYLGMEIRFPATSNDYLVYGFDETFLREHPFPHMGSIAEFHKLCEGTPIRIFQAHPFRFGMTLANPKWIDGLEVYNGCVRHRSHNAFANLWAESLGLPGVAGSDFHERGDEGRGGILLPELPADEAALSDALLSPEKLLVQTPLHNDNMEV